MAESANRQLTTDREAFSRPTEATRSRFGNGADSGSMLRKIANVASIGS